MSTPNLSSTSAAASTFVGGGTAQADAEFKAQIQSLIAGNRAQQEKSNLAYAGAFGSPPTTAEAKINTLVSPNPAGMVAAGSALSYVDVTAETTNGGVSSGILSPPEMVGSTSPQHSTQQTIAAMANLSQDGGFDGDQSFRAKAELEAATAAQMTANAAAANRHSRDQEAENRRLATQLQALQHQAAQFAALEAENAKLKKAAAAAAAAGGGGGGTNRGTAVGAPRQQPPQATGTMRQFAVAESVDTGNNADIKQAAIPYEPKKKKELKVARGDLIMVSPTKKHEPYKSSTAWLHGSIGLKSGYFPAGILAKSTPKKKGLSDFERFGGNASAGLASETNKPTKLDFSKLRRTSSLTVVYRPRKVVRHGPKVNTMVFLVRDEAVGSTGSYGFSFETDEMLKSVSPAARIAIDHADPYGRDNKAGVAPKVEDEYAHSISGTRNGTPAFGRLFSGDVLESLNGVDAKTSSHEELLALIKGWDTMQVVVERAATTALKMQLTGAPSTFGISFSMRPAGAPLIIERVQGGSQADGEVMAGDILEKVNGKNVAAMTNAEVMQLFDNPSSSSGVFNINYARRQEQVALKPLQRTGFL